VTEVANYGFSLKVNTYRQNEMTVPISDCQIAGHMPAGWLNATEAYIEEIRLADVPRNHSSTVRLCDAI
jgi:hypothetical protein